MFAKIIEGDTYVNTATLELCDVIYGENIYTPKGKVYKSELRGFVYAESLQGCFDILNIEEKHFYPSDAFSFEEAEKDALYMGYKTFIYNDTVKSVQ